MMQIDYGEAVHMYGAEVDIDELLESLRTDEEWAGANELGSPIGMRDDLENAIMLITAMRYELQKRWIPCSKRMPKPNEMVLVCCYGSDIIVPDYSRGENIEEAMQRISEIPHVTIGFCDDEGWCGADYFPMMVQPTFWMPLPDPPKGETT